MKTCKAADAPELPQRGRYTSLSLRGDGSQEHAGDFSSKPTSARWVVRKCEGRTARLPFIGTSLLTRHSGQSDFTQKGVAAGEALS
jgi:hypothetical protein